VIIATVLPAFNGDSVNAPTLVENNNSDHLIIIIIIIYSVGAKLHCRCDEVNDFFSMNFCKFS